MDRGITEYCTAEFFLSSAGLATTGGGFSYVGYHHLRSPTLEKNMVIYTAGSHLALLFLQPVSFAVVVEFTYIRTSPALLL